RGVHHETQAARHPPAGGAPRCPAGHALAHPGGTAGKRARRVRAAGGPPAGRALDRGALHRRQPLPPGPHRAGDAQPVPTLTTVRLTTSESQRSSSRDQAHGKESAVTITSPTVPAAEAPPSLSIQVESAGVVPHAAVPTLGFQLRLDNPGAQPVRALALHARLQIAATGRRYDPRSQRRLVELFGLPPEWGRTLRSLPWTRATVMVPAFSRRVRAELPVTCTYDFEVTATKYLHALG